MGETNILLRKVTVPRVMGVKSMLMAFSFSDVAANP
jgi:hypothetical protein